MRFSRWASAETAWLGAPLGGGRDPVPPPPPRGVVPSEALATLDVGPGEVAGEGDLVGLGGTGDVDASRPDLERQGYKAVCTSAVP